MHKYNKNVYFLNWPFEILYFSPWYWNPSKITFVENKLLFHYSLQQAILYMYMWLEKKYKYKLAEKNILIV